MRANIVINKILLVDDEVDLYKDVFKRNQEEITYCSNLVDSIKAIQNSENNFDIAIIDIRFDLSNNSLAEGPYGWILIPLIYEYHPNCKITLNSNSAFEGPTIKKAHFGYKVANISSKRRNPITNDLSSISARGQFRLPDEVKSLIDIYGSQIKTKHPEAKGLRFMDAVTLELTIAIEQYLRLPHLDGFQYWKLLKTGKTAKGKEQPFFCNDYRTRRIKEIKKIIVKQGIKSNSEVKTMDAAAILDLLIEENLLINSTNIATFNRDPNDEQWLILTAQGETTGRAGRDHKCKELIGMGQKKLYAYIEMMHTELFGQPQNGEEIPGRLIMAQKICKHLGIKY
ncbi:hypothetical protein [Pseudoalteromonas marina]|uniref:Response regulatory domain-containing protein n=1 Tax=Pseudoalteromonas marina TaxID=267375 RepID=A0ABT9FGA8_9GAMM|nr:hypothetical protein [Pseudoalteromonas marina]MDP2565817.1 hypothetical protein [Pseudoalteromonas marina]